MCCCTCIKGWFCLGWTISSVVFAFLAAAIFVTIHILLGGPFPSGQWDSGASLVYAGASFTVISGVLAMVIMINFSETIFEMNFIIRWVVFGVGNFFLVVTIILSIIATSQIAAPIVAKDVIDYCKAYRDTNGMMPPALNGLESHSRILDDDGLPLGCCGYNNFTDYIIPPIQQCDPNKAANNLLKRFNAPKSCCKSKLHCEKKSIAEFPNSIYARYELQYFMYRFWIKQITDGNVNGTQEKRHNAEEKVLREFVDWLSGYKGDIQAHKFADDQLPPPTDKRSKDYNYNPKDCVSPLKSLLMENISNWDNQTYWLNDDEPPTEIFLGYEDDGTRTVTNISAKNRFNLWKNYKDLVSAEVKTNVLGCGELIELLISGNFFIGIQPKGYITLVRAVRGCISALIIVLLLHTILNALWFNYYYVPHVLFRGRWELPFFPDKNKVIHTVEHVIVKVETPQAQPSPTDVDKPEEAMAEAEAAE